ncbi:MAG: ribosome biogenesis GTP-binding protein YihA/YsxC [Rikenellaceae bacterium]
MEITKAKFICSSSKAEQCPKDSVREVALIGRSNVGKSSLINMLCGMKMLAKVSGTPGKTRLINHFLVNDEWYLVDLPGYGYAKTSKNTRKEFAKIITDYIEKSENLFYLFVLVDVRHEPLKNDLEFMQYLAAQEVPFGIIFTKADKLSANKCESSVAKYRRLLKAEWEELPSMIVTSSESKRGKEDVLNFIEELFAHEQEFEEFLEE